MKIIFNHREEQEALEVMAWPPHSPGFMKDSGITKTQQDVRQTTTEHQWVVLHVCWCTWKHRHTGAVDVNKYPEDWFLLTPPGVLSNIWPKHRGYWTIFKQISYVMGPLVYLALFERNKPANTSLDWWKKMVKVQKYTGPVCLFMIENGSCVMINTLSIVCIIRLPPTKPGC